MSILNYSPASPVSGSQHHQLLLLIGEVGVASLGQLHKRFWPHYTVANAQKHLRQMLGRGWLTSRYATLHGQSNQIYALTNQGAAQFGRMTARRLTVGLPAHSETSQQLMAMAARLNIEAELQLRQAKLLEWKNERTLRSHSVRQNGKRSISKNVIGDALAVIEEADGTRHELLIEIDGEYYGQMLRQKIKLLAGQRSPVLWVTRPARLVRVSEEIRATGANNIRLMGL